MPVAAPPPTRAPTRRSSPYDRNRRSRGDTAGRRPAKGPRKTPGGYNGRDSYKPNLPEAEPPLPPAPLLGLTDLLALTGAAALWGLVNSRDKGVQPPGKIGEMDAIAQGKFSRFGATIVQWQGSGAQAGTVEGAECYASRPAPVEDRSGVKMVGALCGFSEGRAGSSSQCGPNNWFIGIKSRNFFINGFPCTESGETMEVARTGFNGFLTALPSVSISLQPLNPSPDDGDAEELVPMPAPLPPLPLPAPPFPEPEPEPLTEPEIQPLPLAPPVPSPLPLAPPLPLPAPDPVPPPAPSPSPNQAPRPIPLPAPSTPTTPDPDPEAPQVLPDGSVAPRPQPPVPVIPPGVEQTPDGPIGQPGTPPPPTLEGIAEFVGKIEQKAMFLLERPPAGVDLDALVEAIKDLLEEPPYEFPAGSYELFPPCGETSDGAPGPPKVARWSGGRGEFAELRERLDALAELLQHHKDLRQPVCHWRATGQELTVDFVEDRAGTWEDRPLRKTLSYRDQGGGSLESHTAGWTGFSWQAGPVQLASYGKWGKVQVYASSRGEAERVIRHAAGLAGYDLDNDPRHQWIEGKHSGGRIGRSGTMIPKPVTGGIAVRWRDGPSGPSYTALIPPE